MSHSPLLNLPGPPRELMDDIEAAIAEAATFVAEFDPQLTVIFAPDHYNGFFLQLMPPFCIGTAAQGIGDYGTHLGSLNVPADIARECAQAVLEHGVDVSVSASMDVDHAVAQPLERLFGDAAACPVIPIFLNAVAAPLGPIHRARALGAAVGSSWPVWTCGYWWWDPAGSRMIRLSRPWRPRHRSPGTGSCTAPP